MGKRTPGEGSVRERPDGRWIWQRSIGSRAARRVVTAYGRTSDEAIANGRAKAAAVLAGRTPTPTPSSTLARWLDWWTGVEVAGRVDDGDLARKTARSYRDTVTLHVRPHLGSVRLDRLDPLRVRTWLSELRHAGAGDRTVQVAYKVLSAALADAVRYEVIAANPCAKVRTPRVAAARRAEITVAEARALLTAVLADDDDPLRPFWAAMLACPLRPSEVRGLTAGDVDLDRRVVAIRRRVSFVDSAWRVQAGDKTHRTRVVPVPDDTLAALTQAADGHDGPLEVDGQRLDLVVRQGDLPPRDELLRSRLADLCKTAGVRTLTPYDLRRAAVTLLTDAGVEPRIVQQLAGHTALATTDTYVGVLERAQRDAVDTLAARLRGGPEPA